MATEVNHGPLTPNLKDSSLPKVAELTVQPVEEPQANGRPALPTPPKSPVQNNYEPPEHGVGVAGPGGPQSRASPKPDGYKYSGSEKKFPRISRPVELLRYEYDVVVIGSGYGGGVAASRMARGGQSVCVLELGKERWPGEFPNTFIEASPQIHVSGDLDPCDNKGNYVDVGDPTGLYHLIVGEGQNAFIANGLGGTSLLNANVFLRADSGTLKLDSWPPEIRRDPACLNHYYDLAESVLQPMPYPDSYPELPKLELLRRQAELLGFGGNFYRVPQTTKFEEGPNSVGVEMKASTLSGQDSTGLNDGSKITTLVTYMADAWNWGAEIFCECEVRHIKKNPNGEGYFVYFAWHGSKRRDFKQYFHSDLLWIHAKKFVFLGAGTLGTTEILLRSKEMGLKMSDTVGTGMSGNGDILAFGYNTNFEANAIGRAVPDPNRPIGPTINGVIDCRDQPNPLDGYVIEEGAVPEALAPLLQPMLELMPGKIPPMPLSATQKFRKMLANNRSRWFGPYTPSGSIEKTQVYLIMSHDSNQAILTLENDKPMLRFLGVGRSEHVRFLNNKLAEATTAVGGTYVNSPFFAAFGRQEITVHPIGGACLSYNGNGTGGVTNHVGQLFAGNDKECYDGLICVDGSVVPLALGVNPFATITALAERSVEHAAQRKGIRIDYRTRNGTLNLFGRPAHPVPQQGELEPTERIIDEAREARSEEISFTEVMEGYMYIGDDIDDFTIADNVARGSCNAARFFLSVHAWNTDTLIRRSDHSATLTGTFTCGALSRDPFMVLRGTFQLFNQDPTEPDTTNLTYDFDMRSTDGDIIHFHGYKIVNTSSTFSLIETWKQTTTLYVTLTRGEMSENGRSNVVGRGILHINPTEFPEELLTFIPGGSNTSSRIESAGSFLAYFTKSVAAALFAPFNRLQYPTITTTGYLEKRPPTAIYELTASDGVPSIMQKWSPTNQSPDPQAPNILFIPGAAVDYQIFALPTIRTNAIEYFTNSGYQTFCVTHRVGKTPVAQRGYTTFDARLDIQAAMKKIREIQKSDAKIYIIAHCAGSVALSMALLDGTVPAEWVLGVTASNVFMTPKFATVDMIKARLPLSLAKIYRAVAGNWFSCSSSREDTFLQQMLNQILRFYPTGPKREICNSIVCHRSELVFGRLWTHRNLNAATHDNLSKFLGGTSMRSLEHLMKMGVAGHVMNNNGEVLDTTSNISRLKGIPIFLFSGVENAVYTPESTEISYSALRDQLGADDYERFVFEGRGHLDCWMGNNAHDVYRRVEEHLEQVIEQRLRTA